MEFTKEQISKALDEAYKKAGHNAYFSEGFEAGVAFAQEQFKNLNICVNKRKYFFDYVGILYKNESGQYTADIITQEIEAYDEEHATLLFKEMRPGSIFDLPYSK